MQLDFSHVSREIRSLVSRRRELMMFLGSLFAALGIYLQNVLERKLPESLRPMEKSAFLTYSLIMAIPAVIIALRFAKLHSGMTINGIFYARILKEQIRPTADPNRAARMNWTGVSTQLFLLSDLMASFAVALLMFAIHQPVYIAAGAAAGLFVILLVMFVRFQVKAARFALSKIADATVEAVDREELEDHVSGSLEDCNHDMLASIAFAGLMVFSVFESLSGLGAIQANDAEIASVAIQTHGPKVFGLLLFCACFFCVVIYLSLWVRLGRFSLEIDPSDRPFRIFRITDSLLGYLMLCFFTAVSFHLLAIPWIGSIDQAFRLDIPIFIALFLLYPFAMWLGSRGAR